MIFRRSLLFFSSCHMLLVLALILSNNTVYADKRLYIAHFYLASSLQYFVFFSPILHLKLNCLKKYLIATKNV